MGIHTEAFRLLVANIPTHSKGLTPDIMRKCIVQISNGALQAVAELEEKIEDLDKEIDRLTEQLIAEGKNIEWHP
jgi:uncharacterized small protein (DUF1192 family)